MVSWIPEVRENIIRRREQRNSRMKNVRESTKGEASEWWIGITYLLFSDPGRPFGKNC